MGLSVFCINANPAAGEGGLHTYFSLVLPKFFGANFSFQACLLVAKWAVPRWDPLAVVVAGAVAGLAGLVLVSAAGEAYKRVTGR